MAAAPNPIGEAIAAHCFKMVSGSSLVPRVLRALVEVESESPGEMPPAVGYAPPFLSLILDRRDGHLGFGPQSQRFSQVAHDVPGQLTLQARHAGAVLIVAAV